MTRPDPTDPTDSSDSSDSSETSDPTGGSDPAGGLEPSEAAAARDAPAGAAADRPLQDLQDEILDRLHAGEALDREALLAAHPRHAEALRRFLGVLDVIEAVPGAQPAAAPSRLGEFEILREIGRGGMGVVYEARQVSLNRPVALKVLPPALRQDAQLLARFRREAEAAGRLRHPMIVPVYSVGEAAGAPFFAMELVEGRSVAEVLRARRAGDAAGLPAAGEPWRAWALRTAALVADALAYAHGRGILHRDVKPGNILLEGDGTPRLTDFGLALDLRASELTLAGEVFGSPLYMSPEQAFRRDQPVDARSDIYSLGVTLYEMLTLRLPYEGSTHVAVMAALESGRIVPPRQADPGMPEAVERVLLAALGRHPRDRYATAADFAADLRALLDDAEPAAPAREPASAGWGGARESAGGRGFAGAGSASYPGGAPGSRLRTLQEEVPRPSFRERHRFLCNRWVLAAAFILPGLAMAPAGLALVILGALIWLYPFLLDAIEGQILRWDRKLRALGPPAPAPVSARAPAPPQTPAPAIGAAPAQTQEPATASAQPMAPAVAGGAPPAPVSKPPRGSRFSGCGCVLLFLLLLLAPCAALLVWGVEREGGVTIDTWDARWSDDWPETWEEGRYEQRSSRGARIEVGRSPAPVRAPRASAATGFDGDPVGAEIDTDTETDTEEATQPAGAPQDG